MKSIVKSFSLLVIVCLILVTLFFTSTIVQASSLYEDYAERLKEIGVFKGTDSGFELDREPTRIEAAIMFVRLIGAEQEAQDKKYLHPFIDVPEWADDYVGYLYHEKLTNGTSTTTYSSDEIISARGYMTFILRALGYSDTAGDFEWEQSLKFCMNQSLINDEDYNELVTSTFYRDQLAKTSYLALMMQTKDDEISLVEKLVDLGQIDEDIAISIGLITPDLTDNSFDEESRPNPTPGYSDWDSSIQIYIDELETYVGTAMKVDRIKDFQLKSKVDKGFTFTQLDIVNLIEALDSDGNVVTYVATEYFTNEDSLVKLDSLVTEGSVSFLDILNELSVDDFTIKDYGTTEAPDKNSFDQLRKVYCYDIVVADNSGQEIPIQVFVEVFIDIEDLS
ncbi:hypothetical protein JYG23_08005 [Sedimentibacter sp. zth1]|uniref:hypothetical protein n=1 Tax=Sedimentibacter sp. zth1 TaxID=2816908 RepID=UPI001A91A7FA|nr:hypothetical protein [Sedimentibacter sp. zth1]QSX04651.1 hypothetical protein JYG23_08005 [Sedimentibacter sp. zth1]